LGCELAIGTGSTEQNARMALEISRRAYVFGIGVSALRRRLKLQAHS